MDVGAVAHPSRRGRTRHRPRPARSRTQRRRDLCLSHGDDHGTRPRAGAGGPNSDHRRVLARGAADRAARRAASRPRGECRRHQRAGRADAGDPPHTRAPVRDGGTGEAGVVRAGAGTATVRPGRAAGRLPAGIGHDLPRDTAALRRGEPPLRTSGHLAVLPRRRVHPRRREGEVAHEAVGRTPACVTPPQRPGSRHGCGHGIPLQRPAWLARHIAATFGDRPNVAGPPGL